MDELIERIEKAEAGSWHLERDIALSLGWKPYILGQAGEAWEMPDGTRREVFLPEWTRSIDAAMTLADGLSEQQIWVIWNDALAACSCAEKDMRKDVARFWCAAALRARTTIAGDE